MCIHSLHKSQGKFKPPLYWRLGQFSRLLGQSGCFVNVSSKTEIVNKKKIIKYEDKKNAGKKFQVIKIIIKIKVAM